MIETITNVNSFVNGIVWGWPALILLGFVGVLMTCMTKFFQLSHFGHWIKHTIGAIFGDEHVRKHTQDRSISQFQSLCTALAATVGTGNIVGVAGAIAVGGPGAVFWMWLIEGRMGRRRDVLSARRSGKQKGLQDDRHGPRCSVLLLLPSCLLRHWQHEPGKQYGYERIHGV